MNSPHFSQPQPDENRVTEQEAQAMLELHARLSAHRDAGPTLTDVAEVLRIPESEAKALLERVRAEQNQAAQQQVVVTKEKTTRRTNFRLVTGILTAFILMFVFARAMHHARRPGITIIGPTPASPSTDMAPTAPSPDGTPAGATTPNATAPSETTAGVATP